MIKFKDILIFINIYILILNAYCKEWCKATFEYGKSDYAECISEGDSISRYMIETIPILSKDVDLYSNVSLVLSNGYGSKTKEIIIGNENDGLLNKIFTVRSDIGNPEYIHIKLNSQNKNWKCKKITVWKDYKYWVFDCIGSLNDKKPESTYFLSGNKIYIAYVQTGKDIEAATTGTIEIILLGNNKRSNTKVLHEGFSAGGLKKIKFQASDVGELEDIILINNSLNDPWYCDFVKIKSDNNNKIYIFNVKSWIGAPYDKNVKVNIKSDTIEGTSKDIDCHIRAIDLINTNNINKLLQNKVQIFKVRCPQNCHNSEFAIIEGSSIHPSSTSICAAAIHDGSISPSGGEIIVTVASELNHYYTIKEKIFNELEALDFSAKADEKNFTFFTYHLDSIDDIISNVRIVDSFGKLSSLGRLEIRLKNKNSWGTVCVKGPNFEFNDDAAKRACKDLGFPNGIHIKENCANLNGQNYCAGYKYPFASSGILCTGHEKDISKCNADDFSHCVDHHDDVIIQCLHYSSNELINDGAIRLVDINGAPSNNGIGRLQIYYHGVFGSVCSEGWVKEAENIVCHELGYNGLKGNGFSHHSCTDISGENLCGPDTEKINAVNIKCKGDEKLLRNCPHETHDDIYCSHDEDVIVGCVGGDNNSHGEEQNKKHLINLEKKKLYPKIELTCFDKMLSKSNLSVATTGDVFLASCPEKCDEEVGIVKGTFLYTYDSPICKSAIHSGVLPNNIAEDIVLSIAHTHNNFIGTKRNNIESHDFKGTSKSFTISIPTMSLLREERKSNPKSEDEMINKNEIDLTYDHSVFNNKLDHHITSSMKPTFQWIAPTGFVGFNGKENDYIDCTNLPNEKYIRSLSNFTFIVYFTLNGGEGTWRTILSHSLCEGISISINEDNELIIEQNCNPHLLKSKFKPKFGQTYHISLVFNKINKTLYLYINGKKVITEKNTYNFTLSGDLIIGRSNQTTKDYFIGNIHLVEIYKYTLSEQEIKESLNSSLSLEYLNMNILEQMSNTKKDKKKNQKNKKGVQKTIDGRDCVTPCKSKNMINKDLQINTQQINLKCQDNLLSEQFNGKIGSQFLVSCIENCTKSKYFIKGTNNYYTPDSSICKAAIHAGIYKPNMGNKNNTFVIRIVEGLLEYKSSRGHFGILSKSEKQSQLRSFSVLSENEENIFTCSTDGQFILNLSVGEKRTINCPSNCNIIKDKIYGTNIYSPTSVLCKAAIHSGALSNQGGLVEIIVGTGQEEFKGSTQNNVESFSSNNHSRSITFNKHMEL